MKTVWAIYSDDSAGSRFYVGSADLAYQACLQMKMQTGVEHYAIRHAVAETIADVEYMTHRHDEEE